MVPVPATGSQPSRTEKINWRIKPNQKTGMARPRNEVPVPTASKTPPGFRELTRPNGRATRAARTNATPISSSVAGSRSAISAPTGRLVEKLVPKSPRTVAPSQWAYWM